MNIERVNRLIAASTPATVALVLLVLALSTQSARAQGGDEIYVHKQLGRSDPTVYVGEYLTFTIEIRNDAAFTITTLPLSDTYNAAVLGYRDGAPPPDSAGADWLYWNDLTTTFDVPEALPPVRADYNALMRVVGIWITPLSLRLLADTSPSTRAACLTRFNSP